MSRHDPGSVAQAKTSEEPTEDTRDHRGECAEPDAIALDGIEGRLARGNSQELCQRRRREQGDGEVHGRGWNFPSQRINFGKKGLAGTSSACSSRAGPSRSCRPDVPVVGAKART